LGKTLPGGRGSENRFNPPFAKKFRNPLRDLAGILALLAVADFACCLA
jgi:hypothetical protein